MLKYLSTGRSSCLNVETEPNDVVKGPMHKCLSAEKSSYSNVKLNQGWASLPHKSPMHPAGTSVISALFVGFYNGGL